MVATFEKDVLYRMTRIETKLVRGFEELGINIDMDNQWLTIDEGSNMVHVSTLGRSLSVMLSCMARAGATQEGKEYDIMHRGDVIGTILFRKKF